MKCTDCNAELLWSTDSCPACGQAIERSVWQSAMSGTPANTPELVELLARIDEDMARFSYSLLFAEGSKPYLEENWPERIEDWRQANELGWPAGQLLWARLMQEGFGVDFDEPGAIPVLQAAVDVGYVPAQYCMAVCHMNGIGTVEDFEQALELYMVVAEHNYPAAQCALGVFYETGKIGDGEDSEEAVHWFRMAAESGHAPGQFCLGMSYATGSGLEPDMAEAIRWFRRAALAGDSRSQSILGTCYEQGRGVEPNMREAIRWYRMAAEGGDARAQCNLGYCYEYGEGVKKDPTEAARLYHLAADQGDPIAQCNLGYCYEEGTGVDIDRARAFRLYTKSADQGYDRARTLLKQFSQKLEDSLTDEELEAWSDEG